MPGTRAQTITLMTDLIGGRLDGARVCDLCCGENYLGRSPPVIHWAKPRNEHFDESLQDGFSRVPRTFSPALGGPYPPLVCGGRSDYEAP
jgi:hypothetical protein